MGTGLKENRNSWFARIIVVLLALTFIVGLGYTGGLPGTGVAAGVAATVNGDPVPLAHYLLIRRRIYRAQTQSMDRVSVEVEDAIDRVSLALAVERRMLADRARLLGFRVADEDVASAVKSNPAFQLDGEFGGPDYYKQVVKIGMRMSVAQFEQAVREELLSLKMASVSQASSAWSERELANLFDLAGEKVKASYISFDDRSEAERALLQLRSSGDIAKTAKDFGKKAETTDFFSRLEVPQNLDSSIFASDESNSSGAKIFHSGGSYTVAFAVERKKENDEALREKIETAMKGLQKAQVEGFGNWIRTLYSEADVEISPEIGR